MLKSQFIEAYELRETMGVTANQAGYHRVSNVTNDKYTYSIDESLT